jgi:predicted O-methyltransferase YrrM
MYISKETALKLANSYENGPHSSIVGEANKISMLHPQTLSLLWQFSLMSKGPVLELGPYIGGSTIVQAHAIKPSGRRIITVEIGSSVQLGGVYENHPQLPSKDILGDLKLNLAKFDVSDVVTIIQGLNDSPHSIELVKCALSDEKIGLIFIDSDGHVERDFNLYKPFLYNGAFVVFDDIESEEASEKAALVRPFVEKGIREGLFHDLGIYQWGTWAGQYRA